MHTKLTTQTFHVVSTEPDIKIANIHKWTIQCFFQNEINKVANGTYFSDMQSKHTPSLILMCFSFHFGFVTMFVWKFDVLRKHGFFSAPTHEEKHMFLLFACFYVYHLSIKSIQSITGTSFVYYMFVDFGVCTSRIDLTQLWITCPPAMIKHRWFVAVHTFMYLYVLRSLDFHSFSLFQIKIGMHYPRTKQWCNHEKSTT